MRLCWRPVLAVLTVLLASCAYYPKPVSYYDADCQVMRKILVLEKSSYGLARRCSNEACIAALLSIPLEALVAGSVVVVGNSVLWLEKERRCLLKSS